jgi:hypothetical protein
VSLASPTSTSTEGAVWTMNGSFTDPDLGESYFVQVTWNDGTSQSTIPSNPDRTFTLTHTFPDNSAVGGFFPVSVKVTDSSSKFGTAVVNVAVSNVAPTGTLGIVGNPASVPEGGAASVSFTGVTDPSSRDSQPPPVGGFKYSFDFDNDGTYDAVNLTSPSTVIPSSYLADGPRTLMIKGKVADKDGGFTEYTIPLTITNVAPAVDPIPNQDYPAAPGTFTTTGTYFDPGAADAWTGTVDWNYHAGDTDGVPITVNPDGTYSLNRQFNAAGTFVVRVRITDKDGGVGFTDFTVTVGSDAVAPTVTGGQFLYHSGPRKVAVTFSEDVSASLTAGSLTIHNVTTNTDVPAGETTMTFDDNTNTATWSWGAGALPADGNYHVTFNPAGVKDTSNNVLAAGTEFDFFFLNADANHDRFVDFNDLVPLAQNYNTTVGPVPDAFDRGDFNGDGIVDFNDLVLLAQRYNSGLPAPAAGVPQGTVAVAGSAMPSFAALVEEVKQPGYVAPVVKSKFLVAAPPTPRPVTKPVPKPTAKPVSKPTVLKAVVIEKPKGPIVTVKKAAAVAAALSPATAFSTKKVVGAKKVSDLFA